MMHGGKMGPKHGRRMGYGMQKGGPSMEEMGPMPWGMMGGPWGMGVRTMGVCPWCGVGMGYMWGGKPRHERPLRLARLAKKELLYERIKDRLEKKYGSELDKMADEIVDFMDERMRMKSEYMKKTMEMRQRMWELLSEEPEGVAEEEGGIPESLEEPEEEIE
jgi:hypothetical protein